MSIAGPAQLGKKTKDLVKRLSSTDIAVIDHEDIDRVSAEGLVACGVKAVINAAPSISGRYPNIGPRIIVDAGILLLDDVGQAIFERLSDGDTIIIEDAEVLRDDSLIATGMVLDSARVEALMEKAEETLDDEMEQFVSNTVEYLDRQKGELIYDPWVPEVRTEIKNRQVLVVVRGLSTASNSASAPPSTPMSTGRISRI